MADEDRSWQTHRTVAAVQLADTVMTATYDFLEEWSSMIRDCLLGRTALSQEDLEKALLQLRHLRRAVRYLNAALSENEEIVIDSCDKLRMEFSGEVYRRLASTLQADCASEILSCVARLMSDHLTFVLTLWPRGTQARTSVEGVLTLCERVLSGDRIKDWPPQVEELADDVRIRLLGERYRRSLGLEDK